MYRYIITMIIPIKCFTCGNVLADKYRYFQEQSRKIKLSRGLNVEKVVYLTKEKIEKTPEGTVLDEIGLTNVCCRRHMLTHVDIE
jgi:DNA-directed RNA polymerase subunit N (RpoN/RPB10)